MIIVKLMGGLGNQMFQYAAGRSLSIMNNTEVKLDLSFYKEADASTTSRFYELDVFNHQAKVASGAEVNRFLKKESNNNFLNKIFSFGRTRIFKEPHFHFTEEFLKQKDNTYLEGYWQSEKY